LEKYALYIEAIIFAEHKIKKNNLALSLTAMNTEWLKLGVLNSVLDYKHTCSLCINR